MIHQVPAHRRCTYILPSGLAERAKQYPASPKWARELTHGCWCSSWKLTDKGWRIWRKGRWLRPVGREFHIVWVIEEDGDRITITAKEARYLLSNAAVRTSEREAL